MTTKAKKKKRKKGKSAFNIGALTLKHGHARRGKKTPEHKAWCAMLDRCTPSPTGKRKAYVELGIKVCDRWRNSYEAFFQDMGPKPSLKHSLDRIDSFGNYEPGNCRWATAQEQRLNQRPYNESARVQKAWETRSRISKNRADLTGQTFNRLTAIRFVEIRNGGSYWHFQCVCGNEVVRAAKVVKGGGIKSCGCLNSEAASCRAIERNSKHAADYANKRWHNHKG